MSIDHGTDVQAQVVEHGRYATALQVAGTGPNVLLLHGSGPGATGPANWEATMHSELATRFRLMAPDISGFGATRVTQGSLAATQAERVEHVVDLLRALALGPFSIVGNSMGGGIALRLALHHPDLVDRLVLMGSSGVAFPLTPEVDRLYGYRPSPEAMREIFEIMAYDTSLITDERVQARYQATLDVEMLAHWSAMFGPPRQRVIDDQVLTDDELAAIDKPTLVIHGAHDRVVPVDPCALHLVRTLPAADLLVLGRCGHWTQAERGPAFRRAVADFLLA